MFKKTILIACCTMILTFNLTMSYAKASSFAEQFVEESFPAAYAGVVTTMMTVGAGAVNVNDFMKESGQQIYDTAKSTWDKMAPAMQANFRDSMSKMADGIVVAGDWITSALDLLKPHFGGSNVENMDPDIRFYKDGVIFSNKKIRYTAIDKFGKTFSYESTSTFVSQTYSDGIVLGGYFHLYQNPNIMKDAVRRAIQNYEAHNSVANSLAIASAAGIQYTILNLDGSVVETNSTYNRIDEWMRDVAIPAGNLGVYTPNEAWTNKGYRLGLSADGQQLLTLPDGLPYDPAVHGEYSWRKPLTQVIDGLPAVLDPTTWNWVNARDKTIVKPATIPEIAEYVGTDVDTAEKIKNETKGEGSTGTGSLKNPTKAIIWTPLMMAGTAMTTKFPFSLPWDLINQLKVFDAAPQAPKFDINIPKFLEIGGQTIPLAFTLDLTLFDKVALMVRWFNVIIWDIALILILRKLLPE